MLIHGASAGSVDAVVVAYQSGGVLPACLDSLQRAAPRRGIRVLVVDNASTDDSARVAAARIGAAGVLALAENRGFAAGVNAGLEAVRAPWIAVLNPDTVVPEGALDRLADLLEARPEAGLIGPRVRDPRGRPEASVGRFPTLERERAHAWMLDRLIGLEGRQAPFPTRTAPVDWVSACAWMLSGRAVRSLGLLDDAYFMYYEDVDYCRRLRDAGWQVLATPEVEIVHGLGKGSTETGRIPADGGAALLHYFEKFHPEVPVRRIRTVLASGWRVRLAWRRLRAALGDRDSAVVARRYAMALEAVSSG